ncbi:hypothetical protein [Kaistella polysaccharea]|uniref:hypothetical protein n=1 Tax=Kaistella polysaccharea TaxID=2878534 RepID=UPI001CF52173|nr:hypothetical protein [Kaistella polysaccharea]
MWRFALLLAVGITMHVSGQTVTGSVVDEDQNLISAVLVFNITNEAKVFTNNKGEFEISAGPNDEIRFIRKGFERSAKSIKNEDLGVWMTIKVTRNTEAIEEVRIVYQPTGDLKKDLPNYGDSKPVAKLKGETAKYIRSKSAPEVLAPKPGEFVQPKVSGIINGKVDDQWDHIDFMEYLISYLGVEFFIENLQLKKTEIQPFIYYIFRNFERREILFRGSASSADISRFINESYLKLEAYQNNLPNNPPNKKNRKP